MASEWTTVRAADFIEFNPRLSIKKGTMATKIAMDKLQPFTKTIPAMERAEFAGGSKFCNGDTIMARITPCLENGKTAFVDVLADDEIAFGSTEFIVMRARPGVSDPQFVYYLATSPMFRNVAIKSMVGSSGRQRVQQGVLEALELTVPPLDEQKKIGAFLAALDQKIALNCKINDNLLAQAQAIFKQRFITEEIEGDEKPLYDFADYINGAAFKPSECGDRGLPIIKIAELKNGITDSTKYFDGFKGEKYLIQDKDILFSWSGNPDTSIDIFIWTHGKGILNQHTFNVKSNTGHRWFTFLMLRYFKPEFSRIASNKQTTGLGHVTATDLKRLTFIFNEDVIETFELEVSPFMENIYSNMMENQRLEQLRDNLLPKLMSGELDVSHI